MQLAKSTFWLEGPSFLKDVEISGPSVAIYRPYTTRGAEEGRKRGGGGAEVGRRRGGGGVEEGSSVVVECGRVAEEWRRRGGVWWWCVVVSSLACGGRVCRVVVAHHH